MARRIAALFALALAAFFVAPAAAQADNYGTTQQPGRVSSGTVTAGGSVVFTGKGFAAGATVTIRANGEVLGTVTADAQGRFSYTYTPEKGYAGVVKLTATGAKAGGGTLVVTATVRVLGVKAENGVGNGHLPRTGSELATQLWLAAGLLALGGGLVAVTVTRRRQLV